MNLDLPQNKRIHELRRLIDLTEDCPAYHRELRELLRERGSAVESFLGDMTEEYISLGRRCAEFHDALPVRSVKSQYKDACALYRLIDELLHNNRELKAGLRRALGK